MSTANLDRVVVYAGSRLEDKQRAVGLSDADLARGLDVTTETLRQWKSGRYTPTASKLARAASLLNCAVDDFFITRDLRPEP